MSWRAERGGMAAAQRGERIGADARVDRRVRLRLGKLLGASGQAVAAVPARHCACLAEVADECAHLAAVVGDKREDVSDTGGLRLLSAREAFEQAVDVLGLGLRAGTERIALAQLGRLQLDQTLLVEIFERRHDPAAFLTELRRRIVRRERRPGSARLARLDQAAQEAGARLVEAADDLLQRCLPQRP